MKQLVCSHFQENARICKLLREHRLGAVKKRISPISIYIKPDISVQHPAFATGKFSSIFYLFSHSDKQLYTMHHQQVRPNISISMLPKGLLLTSHTNTLPQSSRLFQSSLIYSRVPISENSENMRTSHYLVYWCQSRSDVERVLVYQL